MFTLISFIANLAFLTFYFSQILSEYASRYSPRKDAFLLSFLGAAIDATFSLAVPFLPIAVSFMDVEIALIVVIWILLLHYRYEVGWLEAVLATAIAVVIYVVILAITSGLWILWLGIS